MSKRSLLALMAPLAMGLSLGAGAGAASAKGLTLHVLMEDVPETSIIEALLPEFEAATGNKVEFEKVAYDDMHDKLVAQLIAPKSFYSLLEVDFLWAGEFPRAGWLTDLKPLATASNFDLSQFLPASVKLLGGSAQSLPILPMYDYSMGLITRTDLLKDPRLQKAYKKAYGVDLAPPATLADYVRIAKFMKKNAGVAGAAMQGQRGDPNSMEFSNYLFSEGGAYLDGKKVVLDSPAAKKALALYVDNIKNGAQLGALSANLDDTMRLMCSGKAFSMVTYWWMLPQLDNAKKCPAVAGKLSLSPMPGGHGESGGWGWGIPTNVSAETRAAAWQFIQWVQGPKVALKRALEGHAPVRRDIFSNPKVLAKYPYYADALKIVAGGGSFPIFTYTASYEDVLGTQVSQAASGQTSVDAAISAAASGLQKLMRK